MNTEETEPKYWDDIYTKLERRKRIPRLLESIRGIVPTPKSRFDSRIHKIMLNRSIKTFLEAGCGEGRFVISAAQKADSSVGIDFSREAIQKAVEKSRVQAELQDNIIFCLARVENLPFRDNSFDLILSIGVIEHFKDPLPLLREMRRVLKPDGLLFLTVPNLESFRRTKRWRSQSQERFGYHDFYIPEALSLLTAEAGFGVKRAYSSDFAAGVVSWWYNYVVVTFFPRVAVLGYLYSITALILYWFCCLLNPFMRHKGLHSIVEATKS
jgi:ubiquinone/menaquinone biosynthesis C-methylase UbiE